MCALATVTTALAASMRAARVPPSPDVNRSIARAASSGSSRTLSPRAASAASRPSTRLASVTVGSIPPRP